MRRTLAKSSMPVRRASSTPAAVLERMADTLHFHGCSACRRTIGCYCSTPAENPVCRPCRGLLLSVYDVTREPQECCHRDVTQVIRKEDVELYALAGPGPWFRCTTCFRHHAQNPLTVSRKSS